VDGVCVMVFHGDPPPKPPPWIDEISEIVFDPTVKAHVTSHRVFVVCPWHEERTPSCVYNVTKNFVYCFGCGRTATRDELIEALTAAERPWDVALVVAATGFAP